MDGNNFDRLSQAVARTSSRRGFFALVGGLLPLAAHGARAAQLGPATCGQSGDVCTMLVGCCSGFTCATSSINVNYGVCVSGGSGGTVSTGTSLISPFSKTIEQDVATLASDPALTSTGTTTTTIEDRKAEIQARKDARKAKRDSRRSTRKTTIQSRRTTRQTERTADEEEARVAAGPIVEGKIISPGTDDGTSSQVVETVRITNRDIGPISIARIESLETPTLGHTFDDTRLPVIQVGEFFDFYSSTAGSAEDARTDLEQNRFGWIKGAICKAGFSTTSGFRVYVAFSANTEKHDYSFLCSQPFTPAPVSDASDDENNRKRKRKQRVKQQSKQRQKKKANGQKPRKKGKR